MPLAASAFTTDLWRWEWGGADATGHVAHFAFATAGSAGVEALTEVSLHWRAAGRGEAGPWARLLLWDLDGWREVAANTADPQGAVQPPWTFAWSSLSDAALAADPDRLRRLFVGPSRHLSVAVASRELPGQDTGVIATDYLEVRVRY